MISRRWTQLHRQASCLTGESEHDRFGGGIDVCTRLDDLFRVMVPLVLMLLPLPERELLDMVELVTDSGSMGRRC